MSRPIVLVALLAGVGTTLVLSELRWFSRRPLDERLLPYVPGGWKRPPRLGVLSVGTFREVVRPLATAVGDLVGQVFGVRDDLPTRLARIHSPLDAAALRVRQLGWAGGSSWPPPHWSCWPARRPCSVPSPWWARRCSPSS